MNRRSRVRPCVALPLAAACAGLAARLCSSTGTAQEITETVRFAPDLLAEGASWSRSAAIDGDLLVIGAYTRSGSPPSRFASLHNPATGGLYARLAPSDPVPYDYGRRVTIDGTTVAVASEGNVFVFDAGDPFSPALLHGLVVSPQPDPLPISRIELADGLLFAAWAYEYPYYEINGEVLMFEAATGAHLTTVTSPDVEVDFARSFAVDGDTLIVGAPGVGRDTTELGALDAFDISSPTDPVLLSRLRTADISTAHRFLGAGLGAEDGTVFATVDDGDAWILDYTTPTDPAPLAVFRATSHNAGPAETSIDFVGDTVLIAARLHNSDDAVLIDLSDPTAPERGTRFVPSDGYAGSTTRHFGSAAVLGEGRVVIGASRHEWRDRTAGAAYLFDLPADPSPTSIRSSTGSPPAARTRSGGATHPNGRGPDQAGARPTPGDGQVTVHRTTNAYGCCGQALTRFTRRP